MKNLILAIMIIFTMPSAYAIYSLEEQMEIAMSPIYATSVEDLKGDKSIIGIYGSEAEDYGNGRGSYAQVQIIYSDGTFKSIALDDTDGRLLILLGEYELRGNQELVPKNEYSPNCPPMSNAEDSSGVNSVKTYLIDTGIYMTAEIDGETKGFLTPKVDETFLVQFINKKIKCSKTY